MQKRLSVMFLGVVLVVFAVCAVDGKKERPVCICPRIYDPVCASNGETYSNLCEFECFAKVFHHLKIKNMGECTSVVYPVCFCDKSYLPVCASDGNTYDNMCLFECHQDFYPLKDLKLKHTGVCKEPRKE